MKTHAPESLAKNTPKSPKKQGQNPSQLGHLAKLLNLNRAQMTAIKSTAKYDKVSVTDFLKISALQSAEALAPSLRVPLDNGSTATALDKPNVKKALYKTANELELAISENYALINLIDAAVDIQNYNGPWGEDHAKKMSFGISELVRKSNDRLGCAFKAVWETIGNVPD